MVSLRGSEPQTIRPAHLACWRGLALLQPSEPKSPYQLKPAVGYHPHRGGGEPPKGGSLPLNVCLFGMSFVLTEDTSMLYDEVVPV